MSGLINGKKAGAKKKLLVLITLFIVFITIFTGIRQMRISNHRAASLNRLQSLSGNIASMIFGRLSDVSARLSGHPAVVHHVAHCASEAEPLLTVLETARNINQAAIVYILDRTGLTTASTVYDEGKTLTGNNYEFRPYFKQALQGDHFIYPALGVTTRQRGIYFSSPVYTGSETPAGVTVIKMGLARLDSLLADYPDPVCLVTPSGVVFSSNREEWLFAYVPPVNPETVSQIEKQKQFNSNDLSMVPFRSDRENTMINNIRHSVVSCCVSDSNWKLFSLVKPDPGFPISSDQKYFLGWTLLIFFLLSSSTGILAMHMLYKKRAMKQLRESEEKYRMFFNSETDAIILMDYNSHIILDVNDKACRLYAYTREEFLNQPFKVVAGEREIAMINSEKSKISEVPFQYHRKKDLSVFPVHVTYSNFTWQGRRMTCGIVRDVTELKALFTDLKDSEEKFRTIYRTSSDAIMLLNEDHFIDCNNATLRLFGCQDDSEFLNRHPSFFSPPEQPGGIDSLELSRKNIRIAFKEGQTRFEWRHRRVDGSEFPAEVWLTAMEVKGERILQAVVRDISDQLKAIQSLV